ncbi:hypothetical protein D3C78_1003480 [compost metagenome]
MFLHAGLCRFVEAVEKGDKALRLVSRVPALAWDRAKTGAQRRQVIGRDGAVAQESGGQKPAEPWAALQHLDHVPGVEQDGGAKNCG